MNHCSHCLAPLRDHDGRVGQCTRALLAMTTRITTRSTQHHERQGTPR